LREHPIGFFILALAMGLGGSQKFLLHIDRRDAFARLEPHHPLSLLILRNLL